MMQTVASHVAGMLCMLLIMDVLAICGMYYLVVYIVCVAPAMHNCPGGCRYWGYGCIFSTFWVSMALCLVVIDMDVQFHASSVV